MDSTSNDRKSPSMVSLSEQLHLHKGFSDKASKINDQELHSKRAAVLVCIFEGNAGDLRVFLTQRTSTMSSHSGEVALPGGKREESDADDLQTALREAKEEIGLDPSLVHVAAVLDPFFTNFGVPVVPVVGLLHNKNAFDPVPNVNEVESIFDVPLEMFLKDENRRAEEKQRMGHKYLLHYFDYRSGDRSYVIWALTAGILIKVASLVYQRPPAFSEQRPPFWTSMPSKDAPKL